MTQSTDKNSNIKSESTKYESAKSEFTLGEIVLLKVVSVQSIGVFLNHLNSNEKSKELSNYELERTKDIFLPFAEQTERLELEDEVLVIIYLDNQQRLAASMKIESFLEKQIKLDFYKKHIDEKISVDLIIYARTHLGYKAIINQMHFGVLYENEVFQKLQYGQKINGFIKQVRPDSKIDLMLLKPGHLAAIDIGPLIIKKLEENSGFLALNEKTPPEEIYKLFGVSKKKYKIILGGLYKRRVIRIETDGIYLVPTSVLK